MKNKKYHGAIICTLGTISVMGSVVENVLRDELNRNAVYNNLLLQQETIDQRVIDETNEEISRMDLDHMTWKEKIKTNFPAALGFLLISYGSYLLFEKKD